MKLSAAAEYAIRGILVLAERYGQGPVTLDEVCARRGLQKQKQYLTKLFALLSRSGLIQPVRGKGGGYMLAKPPPEISLLNVIESIEGTLILNFCQSTPPQCEELSCNIRIVWDDLQKTMRSKLQAVTLKDCLSGPA